MTLPDLTCYLKIAGDYPIAKIKLEYKGRKAVSDAYQKRAGLDLAETLPQPESTAVATNVPPLQSAANPVVTDDFDDLPIAAPAPAAASLQEQEDDWNPDI